MNQERAEEAIKAYRRALEIQPTFPAAWFGKAKAWKLLQNYEQVLEDTKKGLYINPLDAGGLLLFGEACIHCGDLEKARQVLETCLKIDQDNTRAQDLLWEVKDLTDAGIQEP